MSSAEESKGQCPVDHSKLKEQEQKCPVDPSAYKHFLPPSEEPKQPEKCPVDHSKLKEQEQKCPVDPSTYKHFLPPSEETKQPEQCPVDHTAYKHKAPQKEGCDSDAINASNYMPNISQQPQPDQKSDLSQEREISTIPRAESSEKLWVYPSEQMFFNAMRRKNWDPKEKDMPVVVPIHNAVNEQAWQKILQWEGMHKT